MITFLNDRDWQTRAAFFRGVACMAAHAGFAGMEAFLLPCVEQVLGEQPLSSLAPHHRSASNGCESFLERMGAWPLPSSHA